MGKEKELFLEYTNHYRKYGKNMIRKIEHTFRVVQLVEEIALSLNLNEEDTYVVKLAGLLHDIGRFEQYKNYQTFKDEDSINHGKLGEDILTDNFLKKFTDKNFSIIRKAVFNHNKLEIDKSLNEKEKLICNIVRDADKIDILNLVLNFSILVIKNDKISDKVYKTFLEKKPIVKEDRKTDMDNLICNLAFIFDINYPKSLEIIKSKDYLNKLLNKYKSYFKEEELLDIREIVNKYLEG